MKSFVGEDRRALLRTLVDRFDAVAAGAGPLAVSLEAGLGLGKTRVVQELYQELASTRQPDGRYWRATLNEGDGSLLQERKRVEPAAGWTIPGNVDAPWLWWGISCQLNHAGSPMRSLKDASDQLHAHLEPLRARLERRAQGKEDAYEVLAGLFDLVGVVNPGAAVDAGGRFLAVWRRRRQQRRQLAELSVDRRVDTGAESYAEAERIAGGLTAIAAAGTPVVLAVDDAQWADPALVSVMRHLVNLDPAPVLIVTTAWPEKLAATTDRAETFAGWLLETEASRPDRLERVPLGPLAGDALGDMVREFAPRTDASTVSGIAEVASGNPLVLRLLLDLDVVRRDAAQDGSIDTDPATLHALPSDLRAIYQDLWRQLPEAVRRVLALAAVQGPEFVPAAVAAAAGRLGMYDELVSALDDARGVHAWVRSVDDDRAAFTERQRHAVAFDLIPEIFDDAAQDTIRTAVVEHVVDLKRRGGWPGLHPATRRLALETHLDLNEQLGEEATRDLAEVADSMLQLATMELADGRSDTAVALAERAYAVAADGGHGPDLLERSQVVLAEALVAAGRPREAAPLLAEAMAARGAVEDTDEVDEILDEIDRDAVSAAPEPPPPSTTGEEDEWGCAPWQGWEPRPVPSLTELPPTEVADLICEVVATEGPVLAGVVYGKLRVASGATREGRAIRAALDRGVRAAIARGDLVASLVDERGRAERRTLRLPSQPAVVLRQKGDRDTWQIPPDEIAELARRVIGREPGMDRDTLKRRLAELYDWKRYTQPLDELLEEVLPASLGGTPGEVSGAESADQVRARAVEAGVGEAYDAFLHVAERGGLGVRRWRHSTTLTPPGEARHTLVYLAPTGDRLRVVCDAQNFERLIDVSATLLAETLGDIGPVELSNDDALAYAERLATLLGSSQRASS